MTDESRQSAAQYWRASAQDDSDTISRTLNNMKDSRISLSDIEILVETTDSLRRNIAAMKVALEVEL